MKLFVNRGIGGGFVFEVTIPATQQIVASHFPAGTFPSLGTIQEALDSAAGKDMAAGTMYDLRSREWRPILSGEFPPGTGPTIAVA